MGIALFNSGGSEQAEGWGEMGDDAEAMPKNETRQGDRSRKKYLESLFPVLSPFAPDRKKVRIEADNP